MADNAILRSIFGVGVFVLFFTIIGNLAVPYGGYTLAGGDSMNPAIPEGCNVVAAESWDEEGTLKDEIIAYEPQHYEVEDPLNVGWIAHRVVAEYKDYDMDEADYYINDRDKIAHDNSEGETVWHNSNQTQDDIEELEGEHVLILQGDNNNGIDREIVPVENVIGVLSEERHVTIMGLETWPCNLKH